MTCQWCGAPRAAPTSANAKASPSTSRTSHLGRRVFKSDDVGEEHWQNDDRQLAAELKRPLCRRL